ncbi:MAG: hypothetical protein ACI8W8_003107 [Rhodothermales bacterium]|jgi:hypothetical protein
MIRLATNNTGIRHMQAKRITALIVGLWVILAPLHAETITWGAASTISGDADAQTDGTLEYAYAWSNLSRTVNTVPFTGSSSGAGAGTDVVFSGISGNAGTAYASAGNPWDGLSSDYQDILRGADYGTNITVTLGNLTPGRLYAVQLWYHDARNGFATVTQTSTSSGGNSVVLDKNSTGVSGGVGQHSIGLFVADAATQAFTLSAAANQAQINALQVRDIGVPPLGTAISWAAPTTITSDADVSIVGSTLYAYNWANLSRVVNGVLFTGSADSFGAGTDVVLSGINNTTAYAAAGNPWNGLSASYQDILRGADYANGAMTVTLGNLTIGRDYAVQVWYHDARLGPGTGVSQTVSSAGAASVVLDKNSTEANGGVGQSTIGTFTATATNQAFTVRSATAFGTQISALQVRDIAALSSTITWAAPTTITSDADVSTVGSTLYAYNWANLPRIVNGVVFAGSADPSGAGTDVVWSGINNTVAYAAAGNPWNGLSASYQDILRGADYANGLLTVTLGNLTIGRDYAVQLWYHDARSGPGSGVAQTVSSPGSVVVLDKNSTEANGGVGQSTLGTFTASATSQDFFVYSATAFGTQVNALQVRDVNDTSAVPTVIGNYPLGEPGSLGASNRPLSDTPYNQDLINGSSGVLGAGAAAPSSTAYLSLPGTFGYWQPTALFPPPADNYGVEIWARVASADINHAEGIIATLGQFAGTYTFSYRPPSHPSGQGWALSRFGQAYLSSAGAVIPDEWTHLAAVRDGGVTRFFVNAIEVATEATAPVNNGFVHIGMGPGVVSPFKGDVDHMRVFVFDAGDFDRKTDLLLTRPETVFRFR